MKKLILFLFAVTFSSLSFSQNTSFDLSGDFVYKNNEAHHGISFSEKEQTFVEFDSEKTIVAEGKMELIDGFYNLTPTSIIGKATIKTAVRFKIIDIQSKKITIEIYFTDKRPQLLNLVKL